MSAEFQMRKMLKILYGNRCNCASDEIETRFWSALYFENWKAMDFASWFSDKCKELGITEAQALHNINH